MKRINKGKLRRKYGFPLFILSLSLIFFFSPQLRAEWLPTTGSTVANCGPNSPQLQNVVSPIG